MVRDTNTTMYASVPDHRQGKLRIEVCVLEAGNRSLTSRLGKG